MSNIQVLDQLTIDKIAAGEVIERPASIVKELVENAIDAKATSITVEIEDGGISLIRVSDNGCGIPGDEVKLAFLRHSTSKIRSANDLDVITSLGFRGEALSSIAAISQVELITKRREDLFGTKYCISGGVEKSIDEVGAIDGTTFIIRQMFYNTPARRKFLKTPMTEASHIGELMNRLALSHPEISFQFINYGQSRLHTSGNGKLKDVIYHIYGREITNNVLEISEETKGFKISGFIGKPIVSRGNRNYENYFINGRYVTSKIVSKAIEDAYKDFSMQHKYPFTALHFEIETSTLDVNVHPTKMEVRFSNQQMIYEFIYNTIRETLSQKPSVVTVQLPQEEEVKKEPEKNLDYFMKRMKERVSTYHSAKKPTNELDVIREAITYNQPEQQTLFEDLKIETNIKSLYQIIGQIFDTYWLVQYNDELYIIDQHAAHERVLYEKTIKEMATRQYDSQYLSPPFMINVSMQEEQILQEHLNVFINMGFEIEPFGGNTYAIRAVPTNLFGIANGKLFVELLDEMSIEIHPNLTPDIIAEKIASMSCKAAVKGNQRLSRAEVDALISELLKLENPYHCPHGRPTIISMSKKELEKKFKRIV